MQQSNTALIIAYLYYICIRLYATLLSRNMINVGAMDCHSLEHQEYADRIRLYSQRLHQQWNNGQHASIAPKGLQYS